jgi:hypothetical protein
MAAPPEVGPDEGFPGLIEHRSTVYRKRIRRWQAGLAVLLSCMVLFNSVTAFAFASLNMPAAATTAMAGHAHELSSPCCPDQSPQHDHCCQGTGCACLAHCASMLFSQMQTAPHQQFKQVVPRLAESMPITHVAPPPQRPPRG